MKTLSIRLATLMATLVLAVPLARAEDTDIFSGTGGSAAAPQVLIVVDNGSSNDANFSFTCPKAALQGTTILAMVNCALDAAVNGITAQPAILGKLKMGLMVYGKNNNKGGLFYYPSSAPYNLLLMDPAGINAFSSVITSTPIKSEGNAKADGEFYDVWAWFTGNTNRNGDINYASHFGTGALSCQKTFVIFIGGSVKQGRPCTGSGCSSASELGSAGASGAQQVQINSSALGPYRDFETPLNSASWIDEWARFLHQKDFANDPNNPQSITTYTIAIGVDEPNYNQTLQSTADQGGGKAFVVTDINTFINDLLKIFNEIAAVNTAFASSSLPVSANAQGTFLNQIFMGQFRPDGGGGPRWAGNLKQYQFGVSGTPPNQKLFLADAVGASAISGAGTGFISANAQSFWTKKDTNALPDSIGGFWINNPSGVGNGFDLPDGEAVDKGGAAQQIRLANLQDDYTTNPHSPRNVYTCIGACASGNSLSGFNFAADNASITAAILGTNGPAMVISQIVRSATTTATVTLASPPSPALTSGQSVTITGSQYPEFNGTFSVTPVTPLTFTYTVTVDPPTPATGTYTASVPSNQKTITSLMRAGTLVTATVNGHGYVNGQKVTITSATGTSYNGSFVISGVTANTFQYTIVDGPTTPDGGGTAKVGATTLSIPAGGIVRNPSNSGNVSEVTVTLAVNVTFAVGNTVTIAGAGPGGISPYNGTTWIITKLGTSCTGGSKSGSNPRSFCFNFNSTPASPDASVSMKADGGTTPITITGLSRAASACASNAQVLATAVTSTAPTFVAGETVSVGGTPGANETAYVGDYVVASVKTTSPYNFTYNIAASPGSITSCTDATAVMIASAQGVTRDALINWVRGYDSVGDEASPGSGITVRPSLHGDVLHSRPTVVNYGGSTGVVVYYGANDGTFRAINGNQPLGNGNTIGGATPGGEIWSFIPTEFYPKLRRLYFNSPQIKLANTPTGIVPTPLPKDYFFDGSTGVYQSGSTVYLILSGRRGIDSNEKGVLYALDVSIPSDPKFLWKHVGGDTGFEELGQTWSTPKVGLVKGYVDGSGNAMPVVFVGAGYDTNQDSDPPAGSDASGRGIYILDAATGAIVWKAVYSSGGGATTCTGTPCNLSGMTYSIPADITLLNRDFDLTGYIDRLYAADIGGNIWRVDLEPPAGIAPANWKVTKFASLGGSGSPKRKFFYPPDVVVTKTFDMVLAGTGDREHPLYSASASSSYAVKNRFYGLKDTIIGNDTTGWTVITDGTASNSTAAPSGFTHVTSNAVYDPTLSNSGFYIDMPNGGEKIVNAPTTVGGFTYFGTNAPPLPNSQACTNVGTARGYQVNFLTGATNSNTIDGGGLPPSPVAGLVTVNVNGIDQTFPFLLGANPDPGCSGPDCTSSFGGTRPPVPIPPTRRRVYWYLDGHD